ncbi:MAG: hypothetical protein ACRD27_11690 [Terracidiphilus sp.]
MSTFFWSVAHLGWGVFALAVFSALCLLAVDVVWRLSPVPIRRLAPVAAVGWIVGAVIIVALNRAMAG